MSYILCESTIQPKASAFIQYFELHIMQELLIVRMRKETFVNTVDIQDVVGASFVS